MLCLKCKSSDTRVVDSRDDDKTIRRRRECLICRFRFTTYEKSELPDIKIQKRNSEIEVYNRTKIQRGIAKSLEKRPYTDEQIDGIVDDIEQKIIALQKKLINTKEIGEIVSRNLKDVDEVAYLRFISVYKSFSSAKSFATEAKKLIRRK